MSTIAVLGTFDTKGAEHGFIAQCIRKTGHDVLLIDVGSASAPTIPPDVPRDALLLAAGQSTTLPRDRGAAVGVMASVAPRFVAHLAAEGKIHGIISLGGSGGTAIGTAVMRNLPLGFPKVMVSTVASGNVSHYVGEKDIVMFPSIVDIAGLNSVSRGVFMRAAAAVCAMVDANQAPSQGPVYGKRDKPLIVASMFGNTTPCVEYARELLEAAGYEVLIFHATGAGGRTMEGLIESGAVAGVLDVTTTEWADELVGGILSAGPHRLEAAARCGVPAIVAPGCLDMVNFGPPESVPQNFAGRNLYHHNAQTTLMRTSPAECERLGRIVADKLNRSTGPVTVLIPLYGISMISVPGGAFYDPDADQALFAALQSYLRSDIRCEMLHCAINDEQFAQACVERLLENIRSVAPL